MIKFKRMHQNHMLGGVLAGLAYSLKLPTWLVRVTFFIVACVANVEFFGVSLVIIYFLVALFAPKYENDPSDYKEICE